MTNLIDRMRIERKALGLVNEVCSEWDVSFATEDEMDGSACFAALCRAIEQHEAFRQEVSDAITNGMAELVKIGTAFERASAAHYHFNRFIITKPDPLVDALAELNYFDPNNSAKNLYAALDKRGLEIREKSE